MTVPTRTLTAEQVDEFGRAMDELRQRIVDDLGQADADYIRRVIAVQRGLEVGGRSLLFLGFLPPAWLAGVAALSLSKILDNMEIGHNVMHGQYDWMQDPALNGRRFEWDTTCPADSWRHSHNYLHHTFTNIRGKDRDLGYGILRMTDEEAWSPRALGNPLYAAVLAVLFQWGVMAHDLEIERILNGERSWKDTAELRAAMGRKAGRQVLKDYVLFPALTGPLFPLTLAGNAVANLVRNLWAFSIIFCGHFPDGTETYSEEEAADERRGAWYLRQLRGAANITGRPLFHVLTGNLSFQIEHHLFPDLPARRYAEIAEEVQALCERFGLPYNSHRLSRQLGTVARKIARLALPSRPARREAEPEAELVAAEAA